MLRGPTTWSSVERYTSTGWVTDGSPATVVFHIAGRVATDATYQVYQDFNGVSFPNVIEINRPQEEYSIRLTMEKLVINEPIRDDQFALQQPPGSQLVDLDQPNQTASSSAGTAPAQPAGNPPKK